MSGEIEIKKSSGNVFADMELPDAEERMAKAMLSRLITLAIREHGFTQAEAAEVLGTTQPKVSDIMRGRVGSFTMDRLFRYLTALNKDVHIAVTPSSTASPPGRVLVEA
jgi:predicted XRE-type DNA-binding protein